MQYSREFISEHEVPRAREPIFQHIVDTYASETNKVGAVWSELRDHQLDFRLHSRSSSIRQILRHQILSESRFFSEFIGLAEPPTYGPTADVTWWGAEPTETLDAVRRAQR
jgi:hypothetical protein